MPTSRHERPSVAQADYDSYEVLATLIWYCLLYFVSWVPFGETATGGRHRL